MSNDYPPPGSGQDPNQQPPSSEPPPPPPPAGPQWNPQSPGTPQAPDPYGQPPQAPGQYGQPPGQYGQPPGYPPGGGYGAPGGYGQPQQTSPLAIVALVLGIVGICCGQLFVISGGAIVTGIISRNQITQAGGRLKGNGMALSGIILGVIGVVIGVAYWILVASGALDTDFYMNTN
ncbi:MAG: DUF4190 domain-containing protein [Marmoricola sp.]